MLCVCEWKQTLLVWFTWIRCICPIEEKNRWAHKKTGLAARKKNELGHLVRSTLCHLAFACAQLQHIYKYWNLLYELMLQWKCITTAVLTASSTIATRKAALEQHIHTHTASLTNLWGLYKRLANTATNECWKSEWAEEAGRRRRRRINQIKQNCTESKHNSERDALEQRRQTKKYTRATLSRSTTTFTLSEIERYGHSSAKSTSRMWLKRAQQWGKWI